MNQETGLEQRDPLHTLSISEQYNITLLHTSLRSTWHGDLVMICL